MESSGSIRQCAWDFHNPWNHATDRTRDKRKDLAKRGTKVCHVKVGKCKPRVNRPFHHANMMSLTCKCSDGCLFKIGREAVCQIRRNFDFKCYDQQNLMLVQLLNILPGNQRRHIRYHIINADGERVRLCKLAFMKVHGISHKRISTIIAKRARLSSDLEKDRRGTHHKHVKKMSKEMIVSIEEHFNSYSFDRPHYSMNRYKSALFMSPDYNMSRCYREYLAFQRQENKEYVSITTFRKYIRGNTNVIFTRPKRDTCQVCGIFAKKIRFSSDKRVLNEHLGLHLKRADIHYAAMNFDFTILSKTNTG